MSGSQIKRQYLHVSNVVFTTYNEHGGERTPVMSKTTNSSLGPKEHPTLHGPQLFISHSTTFTVLVGRVKMRFAGGRDATFQK